MRYIAVSVFILLNVVFIGCRPSRQINKVIAPKDSTTIFTNTSIADSIARVNQVLADFKSHYINFRTFSAKIKVDVETTKEKVPDLTAVVRIYKDSAIWMSVSATALNFEVYRIFITKNSVILVNKQQKEVQYRTIDYLQEVTQIPFDFQSIQDLLIGNPIFYNDSVNSLRQSDNTILLSSVGEFFKHLITLANDSKRLLHSKLDDVDMSRNRTADINYEDYENVDGIMFSTNRHILIAEKNKIDMKLKFKQVEFNKELSMTFNIPKNYTRK